MLGSAWIPVTRTGMTEGAAIAPQAGNLNDFVNSMSPAYLPGFHALRAVHKGSNQTALLQCRFDEACKQRMRRQRAALQFRVILHTDEPRMIRIFDGFRQNAVR